MTTDDGAAAEPAPADEPSLADDEARLADIADDLLAALTIAAPRWLHRRAIETASAAGRALEAAEKGRLDAAIDETMRMLGPQLGRVLRADVDAGEGSPLATLRAATGLVTEFLVGLGLPAVRRDDFEARAFPGDLFDLGPASFADVDESLSEPGLLWGAAHAHVHLRRRREVAQ